MKIYIDDQFAFEITEDQKKVLSNKLSKSRLNILIQNYILGALQNLCDQTKESLKKQWIPFLYKRVKYIPTDEKELLELIFSQPDYLDKDQIEYRDKANKEAQFKVD